MINIKNILIFLISIILILLLVSFSYFSKTKFINKKSLKISNTAVYFELAKTPNELAKGLSGRKTLNENEGMLFVFDDKTLPAFWMKDMLIGLDIIWINDTKIIDIDKNIPAPSPDAFDSQLTLYRPSEPINYVLEVNSGFCDNNNIKIGDSVTF